MKRFKIEQSDMEITGQSGLALIGQAIKRHTHLNGVDVSAGLNAKLAGLFKFTGVFGISVPDNRRELLTIEPGYLEI